MVFASTFWTLIIFCFICSSTIHESHEIGPGWDSLYKVMMDSNLIWFQKFAWWPKPWRIWRLLILHRGSTHMFNVVLDHSCRFRFKPHFSLATKLNYFSWFGILVKRFRVLFWKNIKKKNLEFLFTNLKCRRLTLFEIFAFEEIWQTEYEELLHPLSLLYNNWINHHSKKQLNQSWPRWQKVMMARL